MCPECGGSIESGDLSRGYCSSCDIKRRTCTECGKLVDPLAIYITVKAGIEIRRGHKECPIDEVELKSIPWYHKLWLIPGICLVLMLYPFFVDEEHWPY